MKVVRRKVEAFTAEQYRDPGEAAHPNPRFIPGYGGRKAVALTLYPDRWTPINEGDWLVVSDLSGNGIVISNDDFHEWFSPLDNGG